MVHGPIIAATDLTVTFQDGTSQQFGSLIAATGYTSASSNWLPHSTAAAFRNEGCWSLGFDNGKALLPLLQINREAQRIARKIAEHIECSF